LLKFVIDDPGAVCSLPERQRQARAVFGTNFQWKSERRARRTRPVSPVAPQKTATLVNEPLSTRGKSLTQLASMRNSAGPPSASAKKKEAAVAGGFDQFRQR
jgi:hypothetical protein